MNVHWQPAKQGIQFRHHRPEGDVTQTCDTRGPDGFWCSLATGHDGWHVAQGEHVYDVWPRETFVPVPAGVTYEDALRAVEDARPWVRVDRPTDALIGKVVRVEGECGITHEGTLNGWGSHWAPLYFDGSGMGFDGDLYVHPDDVPDADLIERIRERWVSEMDATDALPSVSLIRLALSMAREEGDR